MSVEQTEESGLNILHAFCVFFVEVSAHRRVAVYVALASFCALFAETHQYSVNNLIIYKGLKVNDF